MHFFLFLSHLHVAYMYIFFPMSGFEMSLNIHKIEIMPDHHKKRREYIWTRQTLIACILPWYMYLFNYKLIIVKK